MQDPFWCALFHSISALCSAGFSLLPSNLEVFQGHLGINLTLAFLALFGAFGFFLAIDFIKKIKDQKNPSGFISRVSNSFVGAVVLVGTPLVFSMMIFNGEALNFQKILVSFFQTVSIIRSTGFNTVDISLFPKAVLILLVIFMLIGASITGRSRSLRGTSLASLIKLLAVLMNRKRNNRHWGMKILMKRVQILILSLLPILIVLVVFSALLISTEKQGILPLVFETASALCTVGLSMGITAKLSILGKYLIIFLMLFGRKGILIFGFIFTVQSLLKIQRNKTTLRQEDNV